MNFVVFFAENKDKKRNMVGIGITDKVIEHLKKKGGILEEAEKTGTNTDVVLIYEPTIAELMQKVQDVTKGAKSTEWKSI